jgi:2',3'-cyclic-nucleotide 2'-phosphodiesterase (5'-nucleotidase family)
MKYDAIAVGPLDLAAGIGFIKKPDSQSLPWISANLYNLDGSRPFRPYLSIKRAGLNIALIGLTDKVQKEIKGIVINSWKKELVTLLPSIAASHDIVVLLSTLPYNVLKTIADQFPDIKIIIGADRRKGNINGLLHNDTVIAQTASQGKYLGQLSVSWRYRQWGEDPAIKIKALKKQQISIARQRLKLEKIGQTAVSDYQHKLKLLEQKKKELGEEMVELETVSKNGLQTNLPSQFSSALIPLKPSIPEDPMIRDIIYSAEKNILQKNNKLTQP